MAAHGDVINEEKSIFSNWKVDKSTNHTIKSF
jgi:hypothetical protein